MKFHPVVSIFFGVIACFVLYLIAVLCGANPWVWGIFSVSSGYSWFGTFLIILSFILGGVISTLFAQEKKIKYGIFEGLCLLMIFFIWSMFLWSLKPGVINISNIIFQNVMIFLLIYVGGMFGLITNSKYNGFSPLFAVIAGSVIGYSCVEVLVLITGFYPSPNSYSVGMMSFIVGAVPSVIGGFVTTFLSKVKKIKYGIYTGILIILIGLLQSLIYSAATTIIIHINAYSRKKIK